MKKMLVMVIFVFNFMLGGFHHTGYAAPTHSHTQKVKTTHSKKALKSSSTTSQSHSSGSIYVPLPPSQAGKFQFDPVAGVSQGEFHYGPVKVSHIFHSFYVSLQKNIHPKKVIFEAISYSGMPVYKDVLYHPPFWAVWRQSYTANFWITEIRYVLYFPKGKMIKGTYWLKREPKYYFVPAP